MFSRSRIIRASVSNRSRFSAIDKSHTFQSKLRTELIPYLQQKGFELIYDNQEIKSQGSEKWIFKLMFKGAEGTRIEISNSDWRDYTEYFHLYLNSTEIYDLNINNFDEVDEAYQLLIQIIETRLQKLFHYS